MNYSKSCRLIIIVVLLVGYLTLVSCQAPSKDSASTDNKARITGTWLMTARMVDGSEISAIERVMKLALNPDATFLAYYRGEMSQDWILAGQGAFSYEAPMLNLYWDSGRVINLLVDESQPDRIVLHHGRNSAPLLDQEPDEVFVRHKGEKGPTR